jgi:hypothetical protein
MALLRLMWYRAVKINMMIIKISGPRAPREYT